LLCPHCSSKQPDENYIGVARCDSCSRAFTVNHAEGRTLLNEGKLSDAIEKLELASQFMRNTALVFLDLARAYLLNNQIEETRKALERAYEIDSEFVIQNWSRDLSLPIEEGAMLEISLENLIKLAEGIVKLS
jgi:tetratricopeptide (TPR) repeat protein